MSPQLSISACALALLIVLAPCHASAQGAKIRLDQLSRLADKASEAVDVDVDGAMLKMTAGFLSGKQAGIDPKIRDVIAGLTGIYVKSFKFKAPGGYSDSDVEMIRKQVSGPSWSRIVSVREEGELSEVYFWREKGQNGGLVVIAAESEELTVVNIVGQVDLTSLAALGPMIPKLPSATAKPKSR